MPSQRGSIALFDARAKLLAHFKGRENQPSAWDDLWKENEFIPWDKGIPNPALVDVLNDRTDLIGDPTNGEKRKKALVPGCGKGYDCLLLASHGYDAYGLEGSSHAIGEAEKWKADHEKDYEVKDATLGKGQVKFVYGDFFDDDWLKKIFGLENQDQSGFDLVYDYTVGCFPTLSTRCFDADDLQFLSALPPETRPTWAMRMSNLLNKTGRLVCIEFPTYKEPSTGGPPWGLPPEVYEAHLMRPGEEVMNDAEGYVSKEYLEQVRQRPNEKGLIRIAHWQPARTHEIGKGTDWVGVWKHR